MLENLLRGLAALSVPLREYARNSIEAHRIMIVNVVHVLPADSAPVRSVKGRKDCLEDYELSADRIAARFSVECVHT